MKKLKLKKITPWGYQEQAYYKSPGRTMVKIDGDCPFLGDVQPGCIKQKIGLGKLNIGPFSLYQNALFH